MTAKTARHRGTISRERGRTSLANCACDGASGGRKAVGVDPLLKEANQNRLRRIEGQVRGLQNMVEDDRHGAAKREKRPDPSYVRRIARTDLRAFAIAGPEEGEITNEFAGCKQNATSNFARAIHAQRSCVRNDGCNRESGRQSRTREKNVLLLLETLFQTVFPRARKISCCSRNRWNGPRSGVFGTRRDATF